MHAAPAKPTRAPTIKLTQKPACLQTVALPEHDVNPPKFRLDSLFDVNTYECDEIVKNANKCLDRHALLETSRSLRVAPSFTGCCERCWRVSCSPSLYLAKCLTYEDLQLLRLNFDFGLGVFTGLELLTLPQGSPVRHDVLERYESCSLFLALTIVLCQNASDRLELVVRLLDCALHLFDTLGNLLGFGYVMAAFEHAAVARLHETWLRLAETNLAKSNLMANLKHKYALLLQGGLFEAEKMVSFLDRERLRVAKIHLMLELVASCLSFILTGLFFK